jgi:hypothetical protein
LFFEDQGIMHWGYSFDITCDGVSDPKKGLMLPPLLLEFSGYQCQDWIKHLQQLLNFSFLGGSQMFFHIIQGVKYRMTVKHSLKHVF